MVLPLVGGMVALGAGGSGAPGVAPAGGGGSGPPMPALPFSGFIGDATPVSFVTSDGISAGNLIEARVGGFRFPDGSIQTTAANTPFLGAAASRGTGAGARVVRVQAGRSGSAAVAAALERIRDAGPENRYVISLGPGVYSGHIQMKPFVEIEGAGGDRTRIVANGAGGGATVTGAAGAVLRHLTVEAAGAGGDAVAVRSAGGPMHLESVRIVAADGRRETVGVINESGEMSLARVSLEVTGGAQAAGIRNRGRSSLTLRDVSIRVSGATERSVGVADSGAPGGDLRVERSEVRVAAAGGVGTGLRSLGTPRVRIDGLTVHVAGAEVVNEGVFLGPAGAADAPPARLGGLWVTAAGGEVSRGLAVESRSALVRGSHFEAEGAGNATGVWIERGTGADARHTVRLLHSSVAAAGQTVWSEASDTALRIGHSTLEGGPVLAEAGAVACAATVDEAFAFHAEGCPR
ncbi:MAG TPA: hypothetical protein VLF66_18450 [Thermoanaerobaculia bacterium]|nr:hypothetical protein [Thermoanaerobaculia bacterium]